MEGERGMDKLPTIEIVFCLTGDEFLEKDISNKLGITPDEFRTRENWPDAIKNNKDLPDYLRPRTVWSIGVKGHDYAVSNQFEKMMNLLKGKERIINEIEKKLSLIPMFTIVIHMNVGGGPEMLLPKEVINFVSLLNAEIGFDIYIYGDEDDEGEY
jgi:hypothetical protein